MSFSYTQVLPGVYHIQDAMGVCMTLLKGTHAALLIDTGYGLENVADFVQTLTDGLPLKVILTHGHHDHVLGAMHFDETWMFQQDRDDFITYTAQAQRQRVLDGALQKGIPVKSDAYLSAQIAMPKELQEETLNLGGIEAHIMLVPGHTPGSAVVYVPEHKLLLTADDWNPCTWLFFPAALSMPAYRANVTKLLELPFTHVLCSHQPMLFEREKFASFVAHLTDENLRQAKRVIIPPYDATETYQADMGDGQIFVFDWQKSSLA